MERSAQTMHGAIASLIMAIAPCIGWNSIIIGQQLLDSNYWAAIIGQLYSRASHPTHQFSDRAPMILESPFAR